MAVCKPVITASLSQAVSVWRQLASCRVTCAVTLRLILEVAGHCNYLWSVSESRKYSVQSLGSQWFAAIQFFGLICSFGTHQPVIQVTNTQSRVLSLRMNPPWIHQSEDVLGYTGHRRAIVWLEKMKMVYINKPDEWLSVSSFLLLYYCCSNSTPGHCKSSVLCPSSSLVSHLVWTCCYKWAQIKPSDNKLHVSVSKLQLTCTCSLVRGCTCMISNSLRVQVAQPRMQVAACCINQRLETA